MMAACAFPPARANEPAKRVARSVQPRNVRSMRPPFSAEVRSAIPRGNLPAFSKCPGPPRPGKPPTLACRQPAPERRKSIFLAPPRREITRGCRLLLLGRLLLQQGFDDLV